jgi:predicted DNA-binding transcriptional regulator AlpA
MKDDSIMTLNEVAEMTRVPVNTLRFYRTSRKGPRTFKLGKHVVAHRSDVEAWITEAYEAGTSAPASADGAS